MSTTTNERDRLADETSENGSEERGFKRGFDASERLKDERVQRLEARARRVIYCAEQAHLAMPEAKVISMELADLERLRILGEAIWELSEALASTQLAEAKGEER